MDLIFLYSKHAPQAQGADPACPAELESDEDQIESGENPLDTSCTAPSPRRQGLQVAEKVKVEEQEVKREREFRTFRYLVPSIARLLFYSF